MKRQRPGGVTSSNPANDRSTTTIPTTKGNHPT